jgi:hypothetical protein
MKKSYHKLSVKAAVEGGVNHTYSRMNDKTLPLGSRLGIIDEPDPTVHLRLGVVEEVLYGNRLSFGWKRLVGM